MTATCVGLRPLSPLSAGLPVKVADAIVTEVKVLSIAATVAEVKAFFADDHVHLALVVDGVRVVTSIDRSDLAQVNDEGSLAKDLGTLEGRRVHPDEDLARVHRHMVGAAIRRLVVTDNEDRLVGLLCLKRHGQGFCRDEDVQARMLDGNPNSTLVGV